MSQKEENMLKKEWKTFDQQIPKERQKIQVSVNKEKAVVCGLDSTINAFTFSILNGDLVFVDCSCQIKRHVFKREF